MKRTPFVLLSLTAMTALAASPDDVRAKAQRTFARIPLVFEQNVGQGPEGSEFIAHAPGYLLAVSGSEAALTPARETGVRRPLRFRLRGAASRARVELLDPLPGESNYFFGNDPSRWRTHVRQYRRLRVSGVYPGIDMTFYGREDRLEYDFDVAPGADPRVIQMEFDAPGPLEMDTDGDLLVPTGNGHARLHAPLIHQRSGGELRPVRGAHRIAGGNRVSFDLAAYDPALPLVIDPVLTYSTTFTGGRPTFNDVAVDGAGNTYLTGCAASGMPLVKAYLEEFTTDRDVILAKISADGNTLLYSTYLGGGCASSIALDGDGNVVLAGTTTNRYYSLRNPAYAKQGGSFLTKLRTDGSEIVYSTYYGGDLTDTVAAMALDQSGNAWVTGRTRATSFPSTVPLPALASPDAGQPSVRTGFVAKFSPTGAALFSARLGAGLAPSAVALDAAGAAYLGGALCGERSPVTADGVADVPAGCEAFVAKLTAGGSNFAYTYTFGGSVWDGVSRIAVDSAASVYVSGVTYSPDFPVAPNAPQSKLLGRSDAFVAKLSRAGSGLLYSTLLGGTREETPMSLAVDNAGRATVAGTTTSDDFPLAGALRPARNGVAQPLHWSDDGGQSWSSVFSQGEQTGAFYPWRGSVLALAPTSNPNVVYSADRFNIYRSNDGGATWRTAYSKPNQWQVRSLVAHPSNPDALYVVSAPAPSSTSTTSTVWFSSDGGATFTSRGTFQTATADRLNLWVSAADPSVAYALIRRRIDPQLFRTADAGQTWMRTTGDLPDLMQSMALDTSTATRLYAGTDNGMYVSNDSGTSWTIIESTRCPYDRIGCQFQEIYADPANPAVILFARRGGREYNYSNQQLQIHRSDDAGRTWSVATTPVVADAAAFAFDPSGNGDYYVAFTGTNGLYRGVERGRAWIPLAPSAPFWTDTLNAVAVLPLQPSRVLVAASAGSEGFLSTLSTDGGTWEQSTYLGGPGNDSVGGLHVDDQGWFVIVNNALLRIDNSAACDVILSPAEATLNFLGTASRIQVRTGSNCPWRVENPLPWIAVASQASGAGWGNFELIVAPNPSTSPRTGQLTVNGQTLTITQPGGPPCTPTPDVYRILPSNATGDGVAVNISAGCQWSVAKDADWVKLDSPVAGVTTSVIPYWVDANPSTTARRAVLTFTANGAAVSSTHTILQSAPNCKVKVTASAESVPATGGPVTLRLESDPADCSAWVADSGVSWAPIAPGPVPSPGASALPGAPNWGVGNGEATFLFQANNGAAERRARLQMAGVGIEVAQAGADCTCTLKPADQSIDAASFQGLVTIGSPSNCVWTAKSNDSWLRITSVVPTRGTSFSSGPTGNGRVFFTADTNNTGAPRTGTIAIGDQTFSLTQAP